MPRPVRAAAAPAALLKTAEALKAYRAKRDFGITTEPDDTAEVADKAARPGAALGYVIQKHDATRLHYDFRLELDGVLLSWAVPKGPSLDPATKRMAVRTEDHPLAYATFEGTIPPNQYGAGTVVLWDRGHWTPRGDPHAGLAAGKLAFELSGTKLQGEWELVRMKAKPGERQEAWLLFKKRDEHARPQAQYDVTSALPDSVNRPEAAVAPPARVVRSARSARSATSAPAEAAAPSTRTPPAPLPGTVRAPPPDAMSPQLAQLATGVPPEGRWIYETKFDGYRLLVRIEAGVPRLVTRNGHDWTDKMPELARALATLPVDSAWLDGEIVADGAHGSAGAGDFNALQNAFDRARGKRKDSTQGIRYCLFDVLHLAGNDVREAPLHARRALLEQLLQSVDHPLLRLSPELGQGGGELADPLLKQACAAGLEGLIAKDADAPYRGSRSGSWLKLKCRQRQEFVIGGYTARSDDAGAIGSLVLGVHDDSGRLQHAGSVGTGWDHATARALLQHLCTLAAKESPFDSGARAPGRWGRRGAGLERWVRPTLVAEVGFAGWTPAGHIRHASFVALRSDKPSRAIQREQATTPAPSAPSPAAGKKGKAMKEPAPGRSAKASRPASIGGVKVTHGERVIDAASGHTKLDLVRYCESVAPHLLPHLTGRAVALLRGPGGIGAPLFFHKHGDKTAIPGITELDPALWPAHGALLEIHTLQALLGAAQMNVIEFHPWNSKTKNMQKPDRMIFDLDPGEGVAWPAIAEGAVLTRALLHELGLRCWLKTSGGKGLHVVVPIAPRLDFDTVKAFSKAIVEHLSATIPERFVAKSGPDNRVGRIFVDYLRNGEGATTVAAFSARARPGLGVSMPISWEELPDVEAADQWHIGNALERLAPRAKDPWADLANCRQTLGAAMKTLGFVRPAARTAADPAPKAAVRRRKPA